MIDNLFNVGDVFDSSNINNVSDFVNEIVPELTDILKMTFPENKYKQNVRVHSNNRISIACPLCGDSASDSHKKRGNIILDAGRFQYMYKCHNCGAYMSINTFFDKFKKKLSLGTIEYINSNKSGYEYAIRESSMNMLFDVPNIEAHAIDREVFKDKCGLMEIMGTDAEKYLHKRNQFKSQFFLFDNLEKLIYILNLTPSGKIIGVQTKPLYKNKNADPKYKTYKLSNIYSMLMNMECEITDEMDALSMIFNIFNVDYSRPIIVTEGPLDAFLLPNSIALCGAHKGINIEFNFYYMFDDDKTGRGKSIEQMKRGSNVFLWTKYKSLLELPDKKKWDYNDVVNYCKEHNIKMPNVLGYFSNDEFDIIDI
jgi:hypothetical protein